MRGRFEEHSSMRYRPLELNHHLLDRQLLDFTSTPCGKVDDIELSAAAPGQSPQVVALLVGPGAAAKRLPRLGRFLFRLIAGKQLVRVPWSEVREINDQITLRSSAKLLGLGDERSWASKVIGKIP